MPSKINKMDTKEEKKIGFFDRILSVAKKIFSNKKLLAGVVAAFLIVAFFGYRAYSNNKKKPTYQTAQAQQGTLVESVTASGTMLSANTVAVGSNASGVIANVYVRDGDTVVAGQKIMDITLDSSGQAKNAASYSSYLAAKTKLDSVSADAYSLRSAKDSAWKKYYGLSISEAYQNPDGSPREDIRNSSADFQSAQGDWLAAEAKYKDQQAVIAQAESGVNSAWLSYVESSPTVIAPIGGTINNITYVPGMVLSEQTITTNASTSASTRVAIIQNGGTPLASVNLSEIDVPNVKADEKATLTLDSLSGKTFIGKVITVDKIGATSSGVTNYPAVIQFDSGDDAILPNMAVTAKIITNVKDNVLLVPSTSVQNTQGQTTVRTLKNGQVVNVPVETGDSNDTLTEIVSGISEGQTVVTAVNNPTGTTGTTGQTTSPFGGGGLRGIGGFGGGGGGARRGQ